ncbi:MAG: hypothetical protein HY064_01385 [Bacteroidetes bacterium]|nr:hypothetical protein [Bacteroidota bacterium]
MVNIFHRKVLWCCFIFFIPFNFNAQEFKNGNLEGEVHEKSELPNNWENIPYDDPVCLANEPGRDSPDLTSEDQPSVEYGINGKPYSGKTFVSGLHGLAGTSYFQEGIMQQVDGFIPGEKYTITFYQGIVQQDNALDQSGSWEIYIDTALGGISERSKTNDSWKELAFAWEKRQITFTATKESHLIKFLPLDDDSDHELSEKNENGALRMGIDLISISPAKTLPITVSESPVAGFVTIHNKGKLPADLGIYNENGEMILEKDKLPQGDSDVDVSILTPGKYDLQFTQNSIVFKISYLKN